MLPWQPWSAYEALPSSKLRTLELSKRFAVSLSAVREALARLSADGLAVADPQRGLTAAPISAADLTDQVAETQILAAADSLGKASKRALNARLWVGAISFSRRGE
jgi:DNA-binding GntR family transcriptional regulator